MTVCRTFDKITRCFNETKHWAKEWHDTTKSQSDFLLSVAVNRINKCLLAQFAHVQIHVNTETYIFLLCGKVFFKNDRSINAHFFYRSFIFPFNYFSLGKCRSLFIVLGWDQEVRGFQWVTRQKKCALRVFYMCVECVYACDGISLNSRGLSGQSDTAIHGRRVRSPNIDWALRQNLSGSDLTKPCAPFKKPKITQDCIPVSFLRDAH